MKNFEFRMKNSEFGILHSKFLIHNRVVPFPLPFFAFAIGAIVGSFLNVVIHRYPLEESIVFPASRCPKCGTRIRWYDNIPIVSWIVLRGRCRACRESITLRYPLVELANALFYLAICIRTGPSPA